jgi:hypothetical protein
MLLLYVYQQIYFFLIKTNLVFLLKILLNQNLRLGHFCIFFIDSDLLMKERVMVIKNDYYNHNLIYYQILLHNNAQYYQEDYNKF